MRASYERGAVGPLALIHRVQSLDEAIAKANSLPFGLAGYAFTRSAVHCLPLSRRGRGRQFIYQSFRRLSRRNTIWWRHGGEMKLVDEKTGQAGVLGSKLVAPVK